MPRSRDLLRPPPYFATRYNAPPPAGDGAERYYWRASARLKPLLAGARRRDGEREAWAVGVVRLSDDRATAETECAAITVAAEAYIRSAGAAIARQDPRDIPGTLAHAIRDYRNTPKFQALAFQTRRQYDWVLGLIEDWGGRQRLAAITVDAVRRASLRLKDKPRTQQLFLVLLAMMVDRMAVRKAAPGEIVANPARAVLEDLDMPEANGGWVWPREAVTRFAAAADALGLHSIGTAIILNEWLAQRTHDVVRLPRSAYRDGVLHFQQSKTGKYVPLSIDVVPMLRARLEMQLERQAKAAVVELKPRTLLICDTTRVPWKLRHFRDQFARIRSAVAGAEDASPADLAALVEADLAPVGGFILDAVPRRWWDRVEGGALTPSVPTTSLTFGHLRHTGITRLKQAGCSDEEICDISGHEKPETVYGYYLSVTAEGARNALGRREAFERKHWAS